VAAYAAEKLHAKNLDLIVANDVSRADSGFGTDTNLVSLIAADGGIAEHPLMSKHDVADVILDRVVAILAQRA
jgi:phosphopantothenoylcysteine decarboxylase/phosphopantothenate--cysteine ligase